MSFTSYARDYVQGVLVPVYRSRLNPNIFVFNDQSLEIKPQNIEEDRILIVASCCTLAVDIMACVNKMLVHVQAAIDLNKHSQVIEM